MSEITRRIGALIKADAIRRCPTDNGLLRQTIDYSVEGNTITLYSDSKYAAFVEYGTGVYHIDEEGKADPHTGWDIHAIPVEQGGKGFLAWEQGRKKRLAAHKGPQQANWVYAQKVHIEGARAHPFLRPAIHQNLTRMKEIIAEEISGQK